MCRSIVPDPYRSHRSEAKPDSHNETSSIAVNLRHESHDLRCPVLHTFDRAMECSATMRFVRFDTSLGSRTLIKSLTHAVQPTKCAASDECTVTDLPCSLRNLRMPAIHRRTDTSRQPRRFRFMRSDRLKRQVRRERKEQLAFSLLEQTSGNSGAFAKPAAAGNVGMAHKRPSSGRLDAIGWCVCDILIFEFWKR